MVVGTGSHKTCKASSWCSNGSSTYSWEPCAMGQGSSNDSLTVHRWGSEWKSEIPCHRSLAYNPSRNWKSLGGMWPQPPVTFGWEKQCGWEGHGDWVRLFRFLSTHAVGPNPFKDWHLDLWGDYRPYGHMEQGWCNNKLHAVSPRLLRTTCWESTGGWAIASICCFA